MIESRDSVSFQQDFAEVREMRREIKDDDCFRQIGSVKFCQYPSVDIYLALKRGLGCIRGENCCKTGQTRSVVF